MDLSKKTCCVVDNGLFVEIARVLAKSFGKVYLYVPWEDSHPTSDRTLVGTGIEGVDKIDSIWPEIDKVDLWVFPDLFHGPLQEQLVNMGHRVWGSRMGEELEIYRAFFKEALKDVGLPVGKHKIIHGMDALRAHLKERSPQYVKISKTRGDMQTFLSESYDLVEPKLDELSHRIGAKKSIINFICEDPIPDAVELGWDGFCVNGKFPDGCMTGIEIKDQGYVGHIGKMPEPLALVNEKLSPLLRQYQYRNFWSAEARITKDGSPWVIDPCCRAGSPPHEVELLMYENLAEIMWEGAAGKIVEPKTSGEWGASVLLVSEWASKNWQPIDFPKKYRDNVSLHFAAVIEGKYYTVPQGFDMSTVGAVSAIGSSLEDAVGKVREIAEEVKGFYLEAPVEVFDKVDEELEKLKEFGLEL